MKVSENIILLLKETHPDLEVIGDYVDCETRILCKDKFGEVLLNVKYHIKKGNTPTIRVAADQSKYWINVAKSVCSLNYDYSKVKYEGNKKAVIIGCREHGDFTVTPNDFLSKHSRCPKCRGKRISLGKTLNTEEFVLKANKKHNNKYDYSETKYVSTDSEIIIKCPLHGVIKTTATLHLTTTGCSKCGKALNKGGYSIKAAKKNIEEYQNTSCFIYLAKCYNHNELFFKVGITKNDPKYRFNAIPYNCEAIEVIKTNLFDAVYLEGKILTSNSKNKYEPLIAFGGHTECFKINELKKIKDYEK